MKHNDIKALHGKTKDELVKQLGEIRSRFAIERLEHQMGKLKNVRILSILRDDIARINTILMNKTV